MQHRHKLKLQSKLDELYCNYKTEIPLAELRLWFDMKVTKTVWREIHEEFESLLGEYHQRKPKYEVQVCIVNDIATLILSVWRKDSVLKPLTDLME